MRSGLSVLKLALAGIVVGTSACAQGVGAPPMVQPLPGIATQAPDPSTALPSELKPDPTIQGQQPGNAEPPPAVAGPPLDVDRVMDSVKKCWTTIPRVYGTEAQGGVARIRLKFQANGTLDGPPMIIDKPLGPIGTKFAESAAKAIERCQPYSLPPERYAEWKQIEMKFDTIDPDNPPPPPAPPVAAAPDALGSPATASTPEGYVPSVPAPGDVGGAEPGQPQ